MGPQKILQTIYVDDIETLEAVTIEESSGKIAVCGGPDVFIYEPCRVKDESLNVSVDQGPHAAEAELAGE